MDRPSVNSPTCWDTGVLNILTVHPGSDAGLWSVKSSDYQSILTIKRLMDQNFREIGCSSKNPNSHYEPL